VSGIHVHDNMEAQYGIVTYTEEAAIYVKKKYKQMIESILFIMVIAIYVSENIETDYWKTHTHNNYHHACNVE